MRQDNVGLVKKIKKLLETDLFLMKANGERPRPTQKNPMMLLTLFKQKLTRL